jgi:hypothetical protein
VNVVAAQYLSLLSIIDAFARDVSANWLWRARGCGATAPIQMLRVCIASRSAKGIALGPRSIEPLRERGQRLRARPTANTISLFSEGVTTRYTRTRVRTSVTERVQTTLNGGCVREDNLAN